MSLASQYRRLSGCERVDIIPRGFFVGHTQKLCETNTYMYIRHTTLLAVVKRTEAYWEGMVQFPSKSRLILTVNNLSESEEGVQQIGAAVERMHIGKQDSYRVKTPFSWLMFTNI